MLDICATGDEPVATFGMSNNAKTKNLFILHTKSGNNNGFKRIMGVELSE